MNAVGKQDRSCAFLVQSCSVNYTVFGACSITGIWRCLEAGRVAYADREFADKVLVADLGLADDAVALNDDVGGARCAIAVRSIRYRTIEHPSSSITGNVSDKFIGHWWGRVTY